MVEAQTGRRWKCCDHVYALRSAVELDRPGRARRSRLNTLLAAAWQPGAWSLLERSLTEDWGLKTLDATGGAAPQ